MIPWSAVGPIIGGIGSLAGGAASMFGNNGTPASDGTFLQNQFNAQMNWNREQAQMQKDFAQQGIRWRVEDAKAAGLHPLAAIGAAGASYSPTALVGSGEPAPGRPSRQDLGYSLSSMGQGIGRAVSATLTPEEKYASINDLLLSETRLNGAVLDNQYKGVLIAKAMRDLEGQPGLPGQSGMGVQRSPGGVYELQPYEVNTTGPVGQAPGPSQPGVEWRSNSDGSFYSVPAKGQNMDDFGSPGYFTHQWQNSILPFFGSKDAQPPAYLLPRGAHGWRYNMGSWYPVYSQVDINRSHGRPPFAHLPSHMADYPRGDHHGPRR